MTAALASLANAALEPHGPTWLPGACPAKTQNKEDFRIESMAGLWFEYLWEDHYSTGLDHYVCSSFIALIDTEAETETTDFFVYNSVMLPAEQERWGLEMNQREKKGLDPWADEEDEGKDQDDKVFRLEDLERTSSFFTYKIFWEAKEEGKPQRARAAIHREKSEDAMAGESQVANWNKHSTIIDTDYHLYAVGMQCEESTAEDGSVQHTEDYFVWMREKQPSMYMRKRARDALLKEGLSDERISFMNKGSIYECWGKDHHN
jgi:hypothetical protein